MGYYIDIQMPAFLRLIAPLLVSVAALGQTFEFEVASVKIAPPPNVNFMTVGSRGGPGTADPERYTCENCDLARLVMSAYSLAGYEYSGPDWSPLKFNISAKVPPGTSKDQFNLMMQNLLAERFKLKFHYGTKETPVFDLVVAKNGPKLHESADAAVTENAPVSAAPLKKDPEGYPIIPPGRSGNAGIGDHASMRAMKQSMEWFASRLSGQVHRPVNDATGLKGKYDFTMHWISTQMGVTPSEETGPSIYAALQEQLGLKLESKKGTIKVLVVDHAEKTPTEN